MKSKVFCLAPWSNLEILPSGEILPCCKFQSSAYSEQFRITQHTIDDYRNSQTLSQVKKDFLQGTWPKGCNRCQIEEENNIKSKRELDYSRWTTQYDEYDLDTNAILTLSMAIGNVCNLKCIMCGPAASSLWQKEYKDIYGIQFNSIESYRRNVIDTITEVAPTLIHIDIHGGEPFLSGLSEHRKLLDHYIKSGKSKDITIHYTTNGTIWPGDEWTNRWTHFKEIDLQISIDGVGPRYEYIRYPADWNILVNNIRLYQHHQQTHANFRISIAHTVNAYNIFYLEEFIEWCKSMNLPSPWMGKLHNPHHLRPSVWPAEAKHYIINHLQKSKYAELQSWANLLDTTDDSELFPQFQKFVNTHDQYRKLMFNNTFPELAEYL
jgi:sulfatase maturation enzyme AslB (radical SAM superfamily)